MKLTKETLVRLINEVMEHDGLSCGEAHPHETHEEYEDRQKEDEKKASTKKDRKAAKQDLKET